MASSNEGQRCSDLPKKKKGKKGGGWGGAMVSYKSGIREGLRKIEWRSSKIMTLARLGKCTEICEVYRAGRNWKRCDLGAMASIAGRDPPGWLVCEQVHSHVRIGSRKWKQ